MELRVGQLANASRPIHKGSELGNAERSEKSMTGMRRQAHDRSAFIGEPRAFAPVPTAAGLPYGHARWPLDWGFMGDASGR